jgi:branched-chain amino acid transport system permease protein
VGFVAVVAIFGIVTSRQDYLLQGATALTFAIAATGLGLALGLAGEYLLGQLAMFAAGAYITGVLTTQQHWSFWPAAALGIVGAMIVGLALSLVGLRISKFYFALVGFFLVSLIPNIVQLFSAQTGGTAGLPVLDFPSFFGYTLETRGMYLLGTAALAVSLLLVRNVRAAPLGVYMRRMRESTAAVAASGVAPWKIRVSTYVLSSALAGLGGAIFSHISGFIQPDQFSVTIAIMLFAAVLVTGPTTLLGPSIGVLLLYVIPRVVINAQGYTELIYGAIVLIAIVAFGGGVEEPLRDAWRTLVTRGRHRVEERSADAGAPTAGANDAAETLSADAVEAGQPPDEVAVSDLAATLWRLREDSEVDRALVVRGARRAFGAVKALDMGADESITVKPGEVHLLLGPNGSGKTSLLNAVSGFMPIEGGSVELGDTNLTKLSPARVAKAGIGRSFQSPSLPDETTPVDLLAANFAQLEGVSYAHWLTSDWIAWRVRRRARATAETVASEAELGEAMNRPCAELTSGRRRIVDVLIALASRSTIVLLDEPAAGLSQSERQRLGATVRALADHGVGFLIVEHDLELAMRIADHVTVLAEGHLLARGTPQDVTNHAAVRKVLMGAET